MHICIIILAEWKPCIYIDIFYKVYVYTYVYTRIYVCICTYIYVYTYLCMCVFIIVPAAWRPHRLGNSRPAAPPRLAGRYSQTSALDQIE